MVKISCNLCSAKCSPFCLGVNVLNLHVNITVCEDLSINILTVWYRTKFVSQNVGYQIWWLFVHQFSKLVANISSQFHHLVNTGLTVGSLVKWLSIKVAHTCKLDNLSALLLNNWKCLHPIAIILIEHTMPSGILHPMVCGTSVNSLVLILKTIDLFLPCKLIFWKSYQSW